jgi:2-hydroxy-3-keto-5-methylthiopentenyl-1-phosphate phosphatase
MSIEMVFQTVGIIIGVYLYIQMREDKMHQRMNELEKDQADTKSNYNAKFAGVMEKIHTSHEDTVNKVHEVEINVRSSVHSMRDDVTKALNKMYVLIAGLKPEKEE